MTNFTDAQEEEHASCLRESLLSLNIIVCLANKQAFL